MKGKTLVIVVVAVGALYAARGPLRDLAVEWTKPGVPAEQPRPTAANSASHATTLADEVNLTVPFTSQAPNGTWDHAHDEFCEEASVLMAQAYMTGDDAIAHTTIAERKLQEVRSWEMANFGYFEDTNAAQTARILREFLGVSKMRLVSNPTVMALKTALAQGKLVLVPAAGQLLDNPHFRQPGPVYHMVVLKGYTKDGNFVSNDPGTKYGANYVYPVDTIMNAMHDWNATDILKGAKVVIIVG